MGSKLPDARWNWNIAQKLDNSPFPGKIDWEKFRAPLRGNVNTRLAKLDNGDYDAIILAAAGLERLEFSERISQLFTPEQMLPAAAQGVVGIECLESATELRDVLARLNHPASVQTTLAERAIARVLEASCQSPVATYASISGDTMTVTGLVAMPDGSTSIRDSVSGPAADAEKLGEQLARQLIDQGAAEILTALEAANA